MLFGLVEVKVVMIVIMYVLGIDCLVECVCIVGWVDDMVVVNL